MNKYALLALIFFVLFSCQDRKGEYVCTPCDLPCDKLVFNKPGICPHCKMDLIKKSDLLVDRALVLNEVNIGNGVGKFLIEGGSIKEKTIVVHYYKPQNIKAESPVVIVIPGAGRNGGDYRDAWIDKAKKYNLLVLSLEYSENHYPGFWSYNLAGMINEVKINEERTAVTSFNISKEPEEWIFNDFDRIFNLTKSNLHLSMDTYDMFGHSAGGQILHRLAIFKSENKANRILASNSGWYTIPTESDSFPYGLKESVLLSKNVDYNANLVLFLGGKDNASETRGSVRHTPEADLQGLHRLERGKYFYGVSKNITSELNKNFNWKLEIIPGIGHDYKAMSEAAADFLYESVERCIQ